MFFALQNKISCTITCCIPTTLSLGYYLICNMHKFSQKIRSKLFSLNKVLNLRPGVITSGYSVQVADNDSRCFVSDYSVRRY